MNYSELKKSAQTGDILLVSGDGFGSVILRAFTASQYSHIAVLVWTQGSLWVSEVKPGTGFTLTPASQRIGRMLQQGTVRLGHAPSDLKRGLMKNAIQTHRETDPDYSYISCLSVWIAQLTGLKMPHSMVCSTYAQRIWEAGGMEFDRTADPEDFERFCENLIRIDGD